MSDQIIAEAARMDAEERAARKITAARMSLVLDRDPKAAFFAVLALRLVPVATWERTRCMATDGSLLYYHPAAVAEMHDAEVIGCIAHEVMHCAMRHFGRMAGRDAKRWNLACDAAINPLLLAAFRLPAGAVTPEQLGLPAGMTADEYYDRLPEDAPESHGPGPGDVVPPPDPAGAAESDAQWRAATAQAEAAAKTRGDLGPMLRRLIDAVTNPRVDWRDVLRAFVSSRAREDYSWARPSRRSVALGMYLPSIHSDALGTVGVLVDTSGSVRRDELGRFSVELDAALSAYPCRAVILYHDHEVRHRQEWSPSDGPLRLDAHGGGGTDHRPAFDAILREDPTIIIACTDGHTVYPSTTPDVPTLWAMTTDRKAPFGLTVRI